MPIRLVNRVAIVTGAGGGLGRAHALALARKGAKVVVNDPGGAVDGRGGDNSAADRVVREIHASGGEAVASYDSVATAEGAGRIVSTAVEAFGTVDILVNNAGILRDRSFLKMAPADFDAVVQVHFSGTVNCTRAAWPIMMERKYGRIVMTTSVTGLSGNFGQSNYGSAKLAIVGLQNTLKLEGAKNNILVNAVSPLANTRMSGPVADPDMDRFSGPEHVSAAVAWLCSDDCNVSGEIIAAGAGFFTAIRYYRSEGVLVDPSREVSADDFASVAPQVFDFTGAVPYRGIRARIRELMEARGLLRPRDGASA